MDHDLFGISRRTEDSNNIVHIRTDRKSVV